MKRRDFTGFLGAFTRGRCDPLGYNRDHLWRSVMFHGHHHFYAQQELEGLVYQLVPQPGYPGDSRPPRSASEYGYATGRILGGSGHLRVAVSAGEATVDYIRRDCSIAHSYLIPARK
jgi:hypothetical protein